MQIFNAAKSHAHLLLPFAACTDESWTLAMKTLPAAQTRHVTRLLQGMKTLDLDSADAHSLSPPHERALARTLGLLGDDPRDGLIPWAAWARRHASPGTQAADAASAWGLVTPCHWAMGREHATLSDPETLAMSESDSRSLMAAMQPYCAEDGVTLHYLAPQRWLAAGELFRDLPLASLDRVLGRSVDPWLPAGKNSSAAPVPSAPSASHGKTLRRLQNEMQMLLYTHPVNEARSQHRQLPVNSLWFSGTGEWPANRPLASSPSRPVAAPDPAMPRSLADAALRGDWPGYGAAWAALDAGPVRELLARQDAGEVVRLTLCGERGAQTFESAPVSWLGRLGRLVKPGPKPLLGWLDPL